MRFIIPLMALLAATFLVGCQEKDQYPISGEECSPEDPVKSLDVSDCVTPTL